MRPTSCEYRIVHTTRVQTLFGKILCAMTNVDITARTQSLAHTFTVHGSLKKVESPSLWGTPTAVPHQRATAR